MADFVHESHWVCQAAGESSFGMERGQQVDMEWAWGEPGPGPALSACGVSSCSRGAAGAAAEKETACTNLTVSFTLNTDSWGLWEASAGIWIVKQWMEDVSLQIYLSKKNN